MKRIRNLIVLSTFLMVMAFSFFSLSTFGVVANAMPEKDWLSAEEIGDLCANVYMRDNAKTDEIIPIENTKGYAGLCITYKQNDNENADGYVIYSTEYEGVVAFGLYGSSPYHLLKEKFVSHKLDNNKSLSKKVSYKKLSTENFVDYSLCATIDSDGYKITNDSIEYVSYSEEINNSTSSFDYGGFISNISMASGTLTIMSGLNLTQLNNFVPVNTNDMNASASGNCGPTAGTNMIKLWRELMGKSNLGTDREVYNYIVEDVGEDGLLMSSVANSTKRFAKSKGYTINLYNYVGDYFSYFQRDINAGYTILVSVGNELNNCHLVVAVGYLTFSDNDTRYLRVIDGWNNNTHQYLNFDYYTRTAGYRWRIA